MENVSQPVRRSFSEGGSPFSAHRLFQTRILQLPPGLSPLSAANSAITSYMEDKIRARALNRKEIVNYDSITITSTSTSTITNFCIRPRAAGIR